MSTPRCSPASHFDPTNKAFNTVVSATSAATNNYRYDTIELTLTNASGDATDLTNIVQFGMPIELSANGQTRGFLPNVGGTPTGKAVVTAMNGISPSGFQDGAWASGSTPLSSPTDQRETYMGGNNGNSAGGSNVLNNAADWNGYIQALGQVDQHIRIANFFPGVPASGTTPAVDPYFVYYEVSYDGHTVTMTPINEANYDALLAPSGVMALGGSIKMAASAGDPGYGTGNALTQNIYMQSGNITIVPDSRSLHHATLRGETASTPHPQQALRSMYLPATGTVAALMAPSTGGFSLLRRPGRAGRRLGRPSSGPRQRRRSQGPGTTSVAGGRRRARSRSRTA